MTWNNVALCILLCYPIMGSKWFPFGGGPRYLSVLAGPVCMLLIWQASRLKSIRPLMYETLRWGMPFVPFVFSWMLAQFWHHYEPIDTTPLAHLFWCMLLYAGARLVGLSYRHLSIAAGIAAIAYGLIAVAEVFWQGRSRAWGGVYENRFGQYAVWLSALCMLHLSLNGWRGRSATANGVLATGGFMALVAAWLSGSRGALFALPILTLVYLYDSLNWRRGLLVMLLTTTVIGSAIYFYTPMYDRFGVVYAEVWNYFHEPTFTPSSIGIRLELARVSMLVLLDHPLLGPGYTSLRQLYETHPALGTPDVNILSIPGFHSDWFQTIGIGGGLLLVSLISSCGWLFYRARRDAYRLLFLGFSMVFSFSEIFFTHNLGLGLLMACWALYSAADKNTNNPA